MAMFSRSIRNQIAEEYVSALDSGRTISLDREAERILKTLQTGGLDQRDLLLGAVRSVMDDIERSLSNKGDEEQGTLPGFVGHHADEVVKLPDNRRVKFRHATAAAWDIHFDNCKEHTSRAVKRFTARKRDYDRLRPLLDDLGPGKTIADLIAFMAQKESA